MVKQQQKNHVKNQKTKNKLEKKKSATGIIVKGLYFFNIIYFFSNS